MAGTSDKQRAAMAAENVEDGGGEDMKMGATGTVRKSSVADSAVWTVSQPEVDDDDEWGFNPMELHFACDPGLNQDNPTVSSSSAALRDKRMNDIPCKFHDGLSGTCWKKATCFYGHEMYTGGRLAKVHPTLAFANGAVRSVNSVMRLPLKPGLYNEREIIGWVTHVQSPGDFFIRAASAMVGDSCPCKYRDRMNKRRAKPASEDEGPMDAYYFGFSALEVPEGVGETCSCPVVFVSPAMEQKLQRFMNTALNYRRLQLEAYMPNVELVAARVNHRWMRAVVLSCEERNGYQQQTSNVQVHLLETGEKVTVMLKEVCQLPEQFCNVHAAAFRCALFGVSPFMSVWSKPAVAFFKELVENKEVKIVVKDGLAARGSVSTFEVVPYAVQILIKEEGEHSEEWIDVAEKMAEFGYALEWNMTHYRQPFKYAINDTSEATSDPAPTETLPVSSTLETDSWPGKRENFEGSVPELVPVELSSSSAVSVTESELAFRFKLEEFSKKYGINLSEKSTGLDGYHVPKEELPVTYSTLETEAWFIEEGNVENCSGVPEEEVEADDFNESVPPELPPLRQPDSETESERHFRFKLQEFSKKYGIDLSEESANLEGQPLPEEQLPTQSTLETDGRKSFEYGGNYGGFPEGEANNFDQSPGLPSPTPSENESELAFRAFQYFERNFTQITGRPADNLSQVIPEEEDDSDDDIENGVVNDSGNDSNDLLDWIVNEDWYQRTAQWAEDAAKVTIELKPITNLDLIESDYLEAVHNKKNRKVSKEEKKMDKWIAMNTPVE